MKSKRTTFWLTTMAGLLFAGNAYAATFVVDSVGSVGDCNTAGQCTLTAALQASSNNGAGLDTIDATGVSGSTTLSGFVLNGPVEIVGAGNLTVDGLNSFLELPAGSTVSGLTLTNFNDVKLASDSTFAGNTVVASGEVIAANTTNVTISGNTFTNPTDLNAVNVNNSNGTTLDTNTVGYDASGNSATGSATVGIRMDRVDNAFVSANIVHGFSQSGMTLSSVKNSTFYKNAVGDYDGSAGFGGAGHGIWSIQGAANVFDSNQTSGHAGSGMYLPGSANETVANHVAHNNGSAGVHVDTYIFFFIQAQGTATVVNSSLENNAVGIATDTEGSVFSANRIVGNATLGIDLGNDGETVNSETDDFTNRPSLSSATGGTSFSVDGQLNDGLANTVFDVEFFSSDSCAGGAAQTFIGSIPVTTSATGDAPFAASFSTAVAAGKFVTATATGPAGTSEFAACVEVLPGVQPEANVEFYKLNHWVLNKRSWKPLIGLFLGSDEQDVDDIALASLRLGTAPPAIAIYVDINRDGHRDLIIGFIGRFTGATCTTTELELTGELDGVPFTEVLGLRMVGCKGSN